MRRALFSFLLIGGVGLHAADRVDPSTLDKKVLVGYQGWFTCPEDGSGRWTHWSRGTPAPETLTIDVYPDVRELDADERCTIPGMTIDGKPAYLFSSRNAKTVNRHFQWMKQYGIDGVLVQRFVGEIRRKRADGEVVLKNIMNAAKESGRTFAIEYDVSGGNAATFAQTLKDDWMYLVDELKITAHPNYQRHNGKPVVSLWGMGLSDGPAHPPADAPVAKDLIDWFKNQPGVHGRHSGAMGNAHPRFKERSGVGRGVRDDGCRTAVERRSLRNLGSHRQVEGRGPLARREARREESPDVHAGRVSRILLAQPEKGREGESDPAIARRVRVASGVQREGVRRDNAKDRDVRRSRRRHRDPQDRATSERCAGSGFLADA
jgi:hypothetical protein